MPVVVEATQWFKNGDHPDDDTRIVVPVPGDGEPYLSEGKVVRRFRRPDVESTTRCTKCGCFMYAHGWIDTLEGGHIVCVGDWIITGVHGERYPCKPDIFAKTYELADVERPAAARIAKELELKGAIEEARRAVHCLGLEVAPSSKR